MKFGRRYTCILDGIFAADFRVDFYLFNIKIISWRETKVFI